MQPIKSIKTIKSALNVLESFCFEILFFYVRLKKMSVVKEFSFSQCVNVSVEGEVISAEAPLEKRERAMVSLMQDADLRSAAEHLFRKMSVIPAQR